MKAIVYRECGPPEVLKWEEIEKPLPRQNEVLIRVRAASLNPLDWRLMRGGPYLFRKLVGPRKGKLAVPGRDVAGVVQAVGRNAARFKPGDEVFGWCQGACAEYACTRESSLTLKPEHVTFEQAASVAVAALTALQAIRDKGKLQPGQEVLINGGAGGVGTFAVQLAKWFGAHVTAVCSTRNAEMVRYLGAGRVIDYTQEDCTGESGRYDMILDNVGNLPLAACRRMLKSKGRCVIAGAPKETWPMVVHLLQAAVRSLLTNHRVGFFIARLNQEDLALIGELINTRKVNPVIEKCYPLSETAEAMRYLETGHVRGKLVITVG